MIKQVKYKIAVSRAVAAATANENENIPKIKKEEEDYYEFHREPRTVGEIEGREARKTTTINALKAEMTKAQRDIAQVHTDYLIAEMRKFGIPLPDKIARELWLSDREDYLFRDGSREFDGRELLSDMGIHTTRAAIRKERKERFEPVKDRAGFIFGFAGFAIAAGSLIVAALSLSLRMTDVSASHSNAQPSAVPAPVSSPPPAMPAPTPSPPPAPTGPPPLPLKPQ